MKQEMLTNTCSEFLDETMNLNDLPGLAIGVFLGGKENESSDAEFTGARGYRDYEDRLPLEEDSIFHCASVSKLFTSTGVMKLVESGSFGLDDRLCEILPDLRIADRRYEDVTLRSMLTHTSGLGDVSDYHWYDRETDEDSLSRYIYGSEEVLDQPMLWSPDEGRFRYSNIAYEILGQIIAEYSGCGSYEDFVYSQLMVPAGMTSSTMKTFERPGFPDFKGSPSMAMPHEKRSDRSIGPVKYYPYTRQHAPSSTLTSNVGDLLRWGRAHMASAASSEATALLKPETYDAVWRSYSTVPNNGEGMGLGWFIRRQTVQADTERTYTLFGHEGTDDGFRASFWMCPQLEMVSVVLSNLSEAPVKRINKNLFDCIIRTCGL